jgi:DNA primase
MTIDADLFLEWAKNRFGEENIKLRKNGSEICTHSFFVNGLPDFPDGDTKFKLWMNPEGGKKGLENGVYRCWYTDKKGSLISLVSLVDKIPYDDAAERICSEIPLRALELKVHNFFSDKKEESQTTPIEKTSELTLPPYSYELSSMNRANYYYLSAMEYLNQRKIPCEGLYICVEGDYKNRIIIPYYDKYKNLIYYNGRTLSNDKKVLRYMKAKPEEASQEHVLFLKDWPSIGKKIYLTEGEFDAITLSLAGFHGAACGGKYLSSDQIEILRDYQIVLAFDSDEPGKKALLDIGNQLLVVGFTNIRYVRPPTIFKDWNKLLQERNIETIQSYIEKYEKPYTSFTYTEIKSKQN